MFLLGLFDELSWGGIAMGIVGLFVVLWALKYALPTQLFNTTNELLEKRTEERDDARRERDAAKKDVEELEEEVRTLRREIIQRIDISFQDQQTIRQLREGKNV